MPIHEEDHLEYDVPIRRSKKSGGMRAKPLRRRPKQPNPLVGGGMHRRRARQWQGPTKPPKELIQGDD